MARHAALTLATDLPVYFADPHSPWQRPSNENTNGLIREYIPKGNERPRAALGFLTPRESFQRLLLGQSPVASTAMTPALFPWRIGNIVAAALILTMHRGRW